MVEKTMAERMIEYLAGFFYLDNKIFFDSAERTKLPPKRQNAFSRWIQNILEKSAHWIAYQFVFSFFRFVYRHLLHREFVPQREYSQFAVYKIASWGVYLFGLWFWLIVFVVDYSSIALAVELGGMPAMLLGLVNAVNGKDKEPRWLFITATLAVVAGLSYSFHHYGGINTWSQAAEIGLSLGFLVGTLLLSRENPHGYALFIIMNICCAWLMYLKGRNVLFVQQIISLAFMIDAYRINLRRHK